MSESIEQLFSLKRLRANWSKPALPSIPATPIEATPAEIATYDGSEAALQWLRDWLDANDCAQHAVFCALLADIEKLFQARDTGLEEEKIKIGLQIEQKLNAFEDLAETLNVSHQG